MLGVCCINASEGVSSIPQIQANVRSGIEGNMSLYCLGFGNDVDYSFLDVMGKENNGMARKIYEASDATLQLQVEIFDVLCFAHFKSNNNHSCNNCL